MSLKEIYRAFKSCNGVSTDSRTVKKGDLFVALKGPSFDGNSYAGQALDLGANYAVVDEAEIVQDERYFLVKDGLETLQGLARLHRRGFDIPILAITGSNGKTTTKELLHEVLSCRYRVSATEGNLNNHIGVPLTILNAIDNAEFLIVEMGSNQPGDIRFLCDLADPDYGLITNVGASHLERLGSIQGVFDEKSALFQYIQNKPEGHFFLNLGDNKLTSLKNSGNEKIHEYSKYGSAFANIKLVENLSEEALVIELLQAGDIVYLETRLFGDYNLENVAAVLTVGHFFDISLEDMAQAISRYVPNNMRSQIIKTERNTIILDAYNANPSSMISSIESLAKSNSEDLVVILGDMLELGDRSQYHHMDLLKSIENNKFGHTILVGKEMIRAADGGFTTFPTGKELIDSGLLKNIRGKKILIKASRGLKLEDLVPYL